MLEQRSDTFKSTAAHSQAKVLQLEQEKVRGYCHLRGVVTCQSTPLLHCTGGTHHRASSSNCPAELTANGDW